MHKRDLITALLLAGVLTFPARAFTFTDALFSIDIPEGEKTYYYTQRGTNMTGTMLENAQKQDMVLLIGSYNEAGTLQYTFKVEHREGADGEEVAEDLREETVGAYVLDEPVEETVAGVPGWSLSGWSVQNSNYAVKLYVVEGTSLLVVNTMYQPEAAGAVEELLKTVVWSDIFTGMVRDENAVPIPGSTPQPEATPEPTPYIPQPQIMEAVQTAEQRSVPAWPVLVIGGGTAGVIGLFVRRGSAPAKHRYKRKREKQSGYIPRHARR